MPLFSALAYNVNVQGRGKVNGTPEDAIGIIGSLYF
jgi:hypothetical protein